MQLDELRDRLHEGVDVALAPLSRRLARTGLTPNQVTIAGATVAGVAALVITADHLFIAGLVWLFAAVLDLLDGAMARAESLASEFGAFLDSTLDRVSEGMVLAAIAHHFAAGGDDLNAALVVLALLGSLLVSYTRARAEALGVQCTVGLGTRTERVLLLALGLLTGWLAAAIQLLLLMMAYTSFQRLRHVFKATYQNSKTGYSGQ